VTDLEDGTNPIYTYGKDQEEVLRKLALQNAHAQITLARRSAGSPPTQQQTPPAGPPPPRISPDQIMQATADLDNPAKSGQAIATLVQSATGVDLNQVALRNFVDLGEQFEREHPDFYPHPGNKRLLCQEALLLAGGSLGAITREHLNQALHNLQAQGFLHEDPGTSDHQPTPPAQPTFPDESQVQRPEPRPLARRLATGSRSSGFQRPTTPTRTLKYSEAEIRSMPMAKSKSLIESNDRDYAEACEYYFGRPAQATA
jgi:hypothetical protein